MDPLVWRVLPLAVPAWSAPCARGCALTLESTGRFRVNANGPRHDVWLLYRCPRCGSVRKRSIHRRAREDALGSLDVYRRSDRDTALRWAFQLSRGEKVPYRVERPSIVRPGTLDVRIEQPFPGGARWAAFLARELGCSRSLVRAAFRSGALALAPSRRANAPVSDGDRLRAQLDAAGRLTTG